MDQKIKDILDEVGKVIRGKDEQIQMVLTAILSEGEAVDSLIAQGREGIVDVKAFMASMSSDED